MSTETLADLLNELEKTSAVPEPEPEPEPEVADTGKKGKATKAVRTVTPVSGVSVESGIPIPPVSQPNARVYPLQEMEVGDSFFIESADKRSLTNRIRSAISQFVRRKSNGRRYITRCVDGGVRCWRVE